MCGICGIVQFAEPPIEREGLVKACAAMRHRGPDHAGVWVDADARISVGLGAARLVVLDPSPASNQPMHDPSNRFHLVFNGEIYNYRSLRQELREAGDHFSTDGDTEVVLAACARWGPDALGRFNGMWALAFYDSQAREGFLARDRFGIKPLFYCENGGMLAFASELRGLAAVTGFKRTVDPEALAEHLVFGYIAHPRTIYQGARRLAPGHSIRFGESGVGRPAAYYDLPVSRDGPETEERGKSSVRVRRALTEAIVCRRVSDVPLGVFLSGGLDSSIIVAHIAAASGQPVKTFAVGYAHQRAYDETEYARVVARHFGTDHHELVLTERDVLDAIPRILDHLGEPVGDSSIVPTALLSEFAKRFVTVALSGDGGDELFGGYWRYVGHHSLDAYLRIPGALRMLVVEPLLGTLAASKSSGLGNRVRQFRKLLRSKSTDALDRHITWSRILSPEANSLLTNQEQATACHHQKVQLARRMTAAMPDADPLNRILAFDLQHSLPSDMLQKVDLASMMHSLEVRVPFLDHRVVELAMSLPSTLKIDRGLRKRILTDAYRGRLPDTVLDRPKQGFEVPIGEFFRGPLRDMFHDTVTRDTVEAFGLLSYDAVEAVHREHLDRRYDHADVLFALLSLCWWQRRERQPFYTP